MARDSHHMNFKEEPMNAISLIRPAALAGMVAFLLAAQPLRAEPFVYVPLGAENRIVVIDAAKDSVVRSIDGIPAVHGLAESPDGRFLVAGSFEEREPGTAAPPKPTGMSEEEHASHHAMGSPPESQGTAASVSTVSVIRASDGTVIRRIDVPGAVHHVAISPDGRFAAVTHPNGGGISAIDLSSYKVLATIPTGPLPNYAAFSPDGGTVYVSNAGNDTVSAVDTGRWIVRWNAVAGKSPEHLVLSPDGTTIYVNNIEDGTVSVIAVDREKVVQTIPIGDTLHGIDISQDGKTLFVASLGDDKIVAVDLAVGNARSAPLGPAPYHLAVIHDAGKLYVSSADEPKIWVVDPASLAVTGEIQIGGKGHQMAQRAN